MEVNIGDIFKLVKHDKYSNIGDKNDLFIVLSIASGGHIHKNKDLYKIGVFWWSGGDRCGGARQKDMYVEDIIDIGEFIGNIKTYDKVMEVKGGV